jgi:integrase
MPFLSVDFSNSLSEMPNAPGPMPATFYACRDSQSQLPTRLTVLRATPSPSIPNAPLWRGASDASASLARPEAPRGASQAGGAAQLEEAFGDRQLNEITPLMVDAYVAKRAAIRKAATVNRELQILHHMFYKAQEWGKALDNPVKHQRPLRTNNRRLRYLSLEEINRLLGVADESLKPLLITALHTGFRRGELFHLTWHDVDFKQGIIRVVHTKNGERREILMSATLRETLQRLPRRLDADHVFPGKTGRGLVDIRKRFRRALAEAEIEGFVFHDLRHTFASRLVMSGVDLMTVKEFLGHKDIKMTLRYAHLAPDYKRSAISRLDTYMDTSHKKRVTA